MILTSRSAGFEFFCMSGTKIVSCQSAVGAMEVSPARKGWEKVYTYKM
jgi:hypothetical protein